MWNDQNRLLGFAEIDVWLLRRHQDSSRIYPDAISSSNMSNKMRIDPKKKKSEIFRRSSWGRYHGELTVSSADIGNRGIFPNTEDVVVARSNVGSSSFHFSDLSSVSVTAASPTIYLSLSHSSILKHRELVKRNCKFRFLFGENIGELRSNVSFF